jgi:hypothetical protein
MKYSNKTKEDIKKIIYHYLNDPENYDDYLTDLFNAIKNDENLESYLKDLIIYKDDFDLGTCARYSVEFKNVGISWKSFVNHTNKHTAQLKNKIYDSSEIDADILGYMAVILIHELGHAKQEKIIVEDDNYESKIIKLVSDFSKYETEDNFHRIYSSYHDVFPSERMTQISAIKLITDSLSDLAPTYSNIPLYYKKFLAYSQLNGYAYGSGNSPLLKYLSVTNQYGEIDIDCCSLEDKLYYGLPITKDEYIEKSKVFGLRYKKQK